MKDSINLFKEKLPKYNHLNKIRNQLWSEDGKSRVSVMIGAGFSLNANKVNESLSGMSKWEDLKQNIIKELGINNETDESVLELSQRYADEFGRYQLDELIKQGVPDKNYNPGEVHKDLLRLPWADVYTTNYDTLLERTLPYIFERNYRVIYEPKDIPNSVAPRIVKLHGSFPANRPFIFTKEDYNKYEVQFGPFVNMVQQSIMETTFLLIGFSGNDPNFREWMKWVRENLGNHMPKIYMITYEEEEEEKEELLNEQDITLIDFKEVYNETKIEDPYYQMFSDLFGFLSIKDSKNPEEWPYKSYINFFEKEITDIIKLFSDNRETYPGWVILPDTIKKRNIEIVQSACNELELKLIQDADKVEKQTEALFEIIWLYDKFQIPISVRLHNLMKTIVDRALKNIEDNKLSDALTFLVIRLIKEARLDFEEDDFFGYVELLKKYILSRKHANHVIYEEIQMNLIKYKIESAKKLVDAWEMKDDDIEWQYKKAIVLIRLEEKQRAQDILRKSLSNVRQALSNESNNYKFFSIEGIILSILIKLNDKTEKNSRERLSVLEYKHCNPLKELDFLYSRIKPYERKTGHFKEKGFDPNRVKNSFKSKNTLDLDLVNSYSLIMINEETQLLSPNSTSVRDIIKTSLDNLENFYPFYSWITFLQFGHKKLIQNFFSREIIYTANRNSLSTIYSMAKNAISHNRKIVLMLEIMSRIYFSLLKEEKCNVDQIVIKLYSDKNFYLENSFDSKEVFRNIFYRILYDKTMRDKKDFIEEVYKLPIQGDPYGSLSEIQFDPNSFFDPSFELKDDDNINIEIDSVEISRLTSLLDLEKGNIREAALNRLAYLLRTNSIHEDLEEVVKQKITKVMEKEDKISDTILESYLIMLTKDRELDNQFRKTIIETTIPKTYHKGVIIHGDALKKHLSNLKNIFPRLLDTQFHFSTITDEDYVNWLKVFYQWWEDQQEWLLERKTESIFGGDVNDLELMTIFLKNSFLPNIPINSLTEIDIEKLLDIYTELYEHKLDIAILLIPGFVRTGVVNKSEVEVIEENLLKNDIETCKSAIHASYDLIILNKRDSVNVDPIGIKDALLNLFRTRKELTLCKVTEGLANIIIDAPGIFTREEYAIMIQTLQLSYSDIMNDHCNNSSIYEEELELIANLTKLAGAIYHNGAQIDIEDLNSWKELAETNRLPEVRAHYYLFKKG